MSEIYVAFLHGKVIAICEAILRGTVGVIAGSRILVALHFELFENDDSDFSVFRLIDSDTDHLPVDKERRNWSAEALARKDEEIKECESFYEDMAFVACKELIKRFEIKNS
jgi:hypothetical protein